MARRVINGVLLALVTVGLILPARVVLALDCNQNGIEDATDIASESSEDCNENQTPDECEFEPLKFSISDNSIALGETPRGTVVADFDDNGLDDVAVGIQEREGTERPSRAVIFLSQPDGTTLERSAALGQDLGFLTSADVDRDGRVDLVSANSEHLVVARNAGGGNWDEPAAFPVPAFTRLATAADVTGDGAVDLIGANSVNHRIYVLANLGDGSFGEAVEWRLLVGRRPTALATADIDDDGDNDILVAGLSSRDLRVLENSGDGTFTESRIAFYGVEPETEIRTGDLDGDGDIDLTVRLLQGYAIHLNDGKGSFGTRILERTARTTALADFDRDGDLDLVFGSVDGSSVDFLLNNGSAEFVAVEGFGATFRQFATGDLDGDGDSDVVVTATTPDQLQFALNGGGRGLEVVAETYDLGGQVHNGTVADFTGDGRPDVATANGPNQSVSVLANLGDGRLSDPIITPIDQGHMEGITHGDWDDDGDVDLAVTDRGTDFLIILLNRGDGSFEVVVEKYKAPDAPRNLRTADVDGDSRSDVISMNSAANNVSVFRGKGDGFFHDPVHYPVGSGPEGISVVDLDGDGDTDVVTANIGGLSLLYNRGDGTYEDEIRVPTAGSRPFAVTTPDVNGDGRPDLVAANRRERDISVRLNTGNREFRFVGRFDVGQRPFRINHGDLDLDGFIDIVTSSEDDQTIAFLSGRGDGTFAAKPIILPAGGARDSQIADINQDGALDIISLQREAAQMILFLNTGVDDIAEEDFLERICTPLDFFKMSVVAPSGRSDRSAKFLAPARNDVSLLGTHYQNGLRFELHQDFMAAVFPDRFPGLGSQQLLQLTGRRATRDYYVGVVSRLRGESGGFEYGFRVAVDDSDRAELLTLEEVRGVYETLRESFELETLGYFPATLQEREVAAEWPTGPGFPVFIDDSAVNSDFQAYTRAVGFGRLRIIGAGELGDALARGEVSFQNILVLEEAPRDIEGVVSGVITAQPQTALSHLTIRTARRGTPNAFVGAAHVLLSEFEGQLVRLEVGEDGYDIRPAELAEAEAFWETNRPMLSRPPLLDDQFTQIPDFVEIAEMDRSIGARETVARVGGKATNLARLQTVLTGRYSQYQEKGFSIPMRHYLDFVRSNELPSPLDPAQNVTYEAYLQILFEDERFKTDPSLRFQTLDELKDHMEDEGVVDPRLIQTIRERVATILGTDENTRVRFRSSSNIEDDIQFNGAGLYNSTSGCLADDFDLDTSGPSLCDPTRETERGVSRALKLVWSSLWNFRAYEERAFFGIDQEIAAMGVLVNRTFIDEAANGVAFTGNPANQLDSRYLITVQLGEESVVSPEPGVFAETNLLELVDGDVVDIVRVAPSSLVTDGELVLSDAQLTELGELMWHIDQTLPIDTATFDRSQVLLDFEFKFMPDGELAVKQVRPFLFSEPPPPAPTFEVEIPAGMVLCGHFGRREAADELALKNQIALRVGSFALPTNRDAFSLDIVDEIVFGPEQLSADPEGPGRFRVVRVREAAGITVYRFTFSQEWRLQDGRLLEFRLVEPLEYRARGEEVLDVTRTLDETYFTRLSGGEPRYAGESPFQATLDAGSTLLFGSCTHELLPLWQIDVELADGNRLLLEERFEDHPRRFLIDAVQASCQYASVSLGGEERAVSDYWRLVYAALRHNVEPVYWTVLDPPVDLASLERPVRVVELLAPDERREGLARYLGPDFEVLAEVGLTSHERSLLSFPDSRFRRGDANADGSTNLADAAFVLQYLFRRGAGPSCLAAADTNADGRLNIIDASGLLLAIFRGTVAIPEPVLECGRDARVDGLGCHRFRPCGE